MLIYEKGKSQPSPNMAAIIINRMEL